MTSAAASTPRRHMSAATFVTRWYTPLAFREATERRVVAALAAVCAVVWLVVIPLELVLHDRASRPVGPQAQPAAKPPG
jgi:hypothetical protein